MLEADTIDAAQTWAPVIIQGLITVGAIFGGAGFWTWKQNKDQAKRDAEEKKNGVEGKVDKVSEQITELIGQNNSLSDKVDTLSEDFQELKEDLALLQEANEATIKYREIRDKKDKEAVAVQQAIIESITGLMRDRLLDNYKRCMKKGYYTMAEREIYGRMFECYEKAPFNGNGVMHDLRPLIKALPMKADDAGTLADSDSED